jgi:hypothetical protein
MNFESSTFEDPIVSEVRAVRHNLDAMFGHDLQKISEDLMKRQAGLGERLRVSGTPPRE